MFKQFRKRLFARRHHSRGEPNNSVTGSDTDSDCASTSSVSHNIGRHSCSGILKETTIGGDCHVGNISTGNTTIHNVTNITGNSPSTSQQSAEDEANLDKEADALRSALLEEYKDLNLPNVPWMDQRNLAIHTYYMQLELRETKRNIEIEDIFDDVLVEKGDHMESVIPTRIFIEAPPGYGKTTLAYKIAYDWATNASYTTRFKLAFLIPLRYVTQSILYTLSEKAKRIDVEKLQQVPVDDIIKHFASDTLLILDGFDEMSSKHKEHVLNVLYKKNLRSCTVILTCRTGMYELTPSDKDKLFGGIHKNSNFSDKKLNILGVDYHNRLVLIRKFIDDKIVGQFVWSKDQIITRIEKIIEPVEELFNCPLCLILLIYIVTDSDEELLIETRTDLFKCIVDCIIRRSLCKLGDECDDFSLFDACKSNSSVEERLYKFGKDSFERIISGNLQFKNNAEMAEIYKMGLLIAHETKKQFTVVKHYEIFHLSFLEFVVAFSMWVDFKVNNNKFSQDIIDKINALFKEKQDSTLVTPFLAGFLGENAHCLFDQLDPYAAIYSISKCGVGFILEECKESDKLVTSITKFFPPILDSEKIDLLSKLHCIRGNAFKQVCENRRLNGIDTTNVELFEYLPEKLPDCHILIDCASVHDWSVENAYLKQLQCKAFEFHYDDYVTDDDIKVSFDVICLAQANEKILRFAENADLDQAVYYMHENLLGNKTITELSCFLTGDSDLRIESENSEAITIQKYGPAALALIKHMINHNGLEKLCVVLTNVIDNSCLNDILFIVSLSSKLHTLCLIDDSDTDCSSIPVDLNKLTRNGMKQWKEIILLGLEIKGCVLTNHCTSISKLFYFTKQNGTTLNMTGLEILSCSYEFILDFYITKSYWNEFDTLKELSIYYVDDESIFFLFPFLSLINYTKSRNISLKISIFSDNLIVACNAIFECLPFAKVTEFTIFLDPDSIDCIHRLFELFCQEFFELEILVIYTDNFEIIEDIFVMSNLLKLLDFGFLRKILFLTLNSLGSGLSLASCYKFLAYNIEHVSVQNDFFQFLNLTDFDFDFETHIFQGFSVTVK